MPKNLSREQVEAILKRFKRVAVTHIDAENLKNYSFDAMQDFDTDEIVLRLFHRPYGEIITEVRYPENWKEAIKDAFCNWVNKLYKKLCEHSKKPLNSLILLDTYRLVKYKRYDVTAYYPQISFPNEENIMTFRLKEVL